MALDDLFRNWKRQLSYVSTCMTLTYHCSQSFTFYYFPHRLSMFNQLHTQRIVLYRLDILFVSRHSLLSIITYLLSERPYNPGIRLLAVRYSSLFAAFVNVNSPLYTSIGIIIEYVLCQENPSAHVSLLL